MTRPKSPHLVVRHDQEEVVIPLVLRETLIGRIDSNHVVLTDPDVSRVHARILLEPDGVVIEDCGSSEGTLVNGDPIDRAVLRDGDVLQLGSAKLLFVE